MAKDPYRYFRAEVRELLDGLGSGLLELEKGGAGRETVARLLRHAHTLKGASRVVKQVAIAELAHAIEDVLAPFRQGEAVPRDRVDALLALVDAIRGKVLELDPPPRETDAVVPTGPTPRPPALATVARLDPPVAEPPPAPAPSPLDRFETVRVDLGDMDALIEGVAQSRIHLGGIRRAAGILDEASRAASALEGRLSERSSPQGGGSTVRARSLLEEITGSVARARRDLAAALDRAEREVNGVRARADRIRLVPASTIFDALARATRDAARSERKAVEFRATGGDLGLDTHVAAGVRDALMHVVRNAVAHGIEPGAERQSAGKAPEGLVRVSVERHGRRLTFLCHDDGRGIDAAAVGRAAARRGALPERDAATLSEARAIEILLLGGTSTAPQVSELAGRGVGLDVLREVAERLGGTVSARTEKGRGTTIELSVPSSVSTVPALVVEAAAATNVAIPLDGVLRLARVPAAQVSRAGHSETVLIADQAVPFRDLSSLLGLDGAVERASRTWTVVVVRSGHSLAAIGVERLVGIRELVVRPLPIHAGASALVSGLSMDDEGNPELVLDPVALAAAARTDEPPGRGSEPARRARILVIDDSLTTRMLEQSILETAGYDVDVASSAEEALVLAVDRDYAVFVCDVEMPGIGGYGFLQRTLADPALRAIPTILVTSLGSEPDRRRGLAAGARDYIAKGEFDESRLLRTIREAL